MANNDPSPTGGVPLKPTAISLTITLTREEIGITEHGEYTRLLVKGGASRGVPGEPALPWKKYFVAVPAGAVLGTARIEHARVVLLATNITIGPCQPNFPTTVGSQVSWVPPDPEVYASDKLLPETSAQLIGLRQLGGFSMAEIELCPFRYRPRSKSLQLVERIELTLTLTVPVKTWSEMGRLEHYYADRVRAMVLNPWDVSTREPLPAPPPRASHVIVTARALIPSFQRLAAWRTHLGLRCRVVAVEDILAGSVPDTSGAVFWRTGGYHDGGTRDTAEAIRNFLKWANREWATRYVLLGGDTGIVPVRKALDPQLGVVGYDNIGYSDLGKILGYNPQASSVKPGSSAASIFDEDLGTVWGCDPSDTNPWIALTLNPHTPVNRVDLRWGATYATGYRIEVSHDASAWASVYSTSQATGGVQQIPFACTSGQYLRLIVTSGAAFALATLRIYGPPSGYFGGVAYAMGPAVTRIYLTRALEMNPANSPDLDQILLRDDSSVVPYDVNASPTNPGWFFVDDLVNPQPGPAAGSTRFVEIRGPARFHGRQFLLKHDWNYIATDLYYSDLLGQGYEGQGAGGVTHDWDANRNMVYAEEYNSSRDGVNGMADVFVGRAPVRTLAEADVFIDKVIRYEQYQFRDQFGQTVPLPATFAVSVLLGSENFYRPNTAGLLDDSAQGKEDIRKDLLAIDSSRWTFTRRYQDFADVPPADQGVDLADVSKAALMAAIAAGQNIVSLSAHGTVDQCGSLYWMDLDGEFSPPSVWYVNACDTNMFDAASGDVLSEVAMLNTNGAAVAYVGNTRFGFSADNPQERAFWDELLVSGELGSMLERSHVTAWGAWPKYSLNLLGDPAMRVWSDSPRQLTVVHVSEVLIGLITDPPGSQAFAVRVSSGGAPVPRASVCLVMGDSLFVTGTTDGSGFASLQIALTEVGTMSISVSGANLIPYLGIVRVRSLYWPWPLWRWLLRASRGALSACGRLRRGARAQGAAHAAGGR